MVLLASALVALAGTLTEFLVDILKTTFNSTGRERDSDVRLSIAPLTDHRAYKFFR